MTEEEFRKTMSDRAGQALVLFTAPAWCIPCRRFEPHWEKAQTVAQLEHLEFVKVDMGESPEDTGAHWATERFGIMGVPQVYLFPVTLSSAAPRVIKARAIVPLIKEING